MAKKVLIATDLHKRMKDLTTIRGYCAANRAVQTDLMQFIKDNDVDYMALAGDWYDAGYGSDVGAALAHTDMDIEMNRLLKGNLYGVIGNHIRIRMDSNPELFLIQPHDIYKSRWETDRKEQIIKTPNYFMVDNLQISLCHYNPMADVAMSYAPIRQPEADYHVAIFHTEKVIPKELLSNVNAYMTSSYSDLAKALEGVDYAVVGHIHKPLGICRVPHDDGSQTVVYVPGSLANTEVSQNSMHDEVQLPMFTVEDGKVSVSYHTFSLHTEMCEFAKKGSKTEEDVKLGALRHNSNEYLYEDMVGQTVSEEDQIYMSLNLFLDKNNYTPVDRNLIKSVIHNPEDINELLSIFKTIQEVSEI